MSIPAKFDIDPADLDADCVAENQTTGGAANLVLNGALCDLGTAGAMDIADAYSSGIAGIKLLVGNAGNVASVVHTITGTDQYGNAQTDTVTGVNTNTVSTAKYFATVSSIAVNGAIATNGYVGTATGELVSKVYTLNKYNPNGANVAIGGLSGTCQFDIQVTYDDPGDGFDSNTVWIDAQSNKSANLTATLPIGATAVRVKFDSYTNAAEFQFYVMDQPFVNGC